MATLPQGRSSGLMAAQNGSVYAYRPTNPSGYVQIATAPGSQNVVMNSPVKIDSGQPLDAGWWVMVSGPGNNRDNCQLVESDGATPAPVSGDAYLLALEAAP